MHLAGRTAIGPNWHRTRENEMSVMFSQKAAGQWGHVIPFNAQGGGRFGHRAFWLAMVTAASNAGLFATSHN